MPVIKDSLKTEHNSTSVEATSHIQSNGGIVIPQLLRQVAGFRTGQTLRMVADSFSNTIVIKLEPVKKIKHSPAEDEVPKRPPFQLSAREKTP